MHEDRRIELFRRAPDHIERRIVQVAAIGAMAMLVRIDVRADLRAAQAEVADTALQFARRQIGILQRDRGQAGETRRMLAHDFGDVIIQAAREIERIGRLRPIAEHHRHGREHLHRNAGAIAFLDASHGIPDVIGNLAKDAIADHHPRTARLVMIQPNESAVAILRVEVRPLPRENVRVQVDLHLMRNHRVDRAVPCSIRPRINQADAVSPSEAVDPP